MSNSKLGPIHLSTAAWQGPEVGPLQAFADLEHPWALWAQAQEKPPGPPFCGPFLGSMAKALRPKPPAGPWRLVGGDVGDRQKAKQELSEMLRQVGAWGCPFLILPEGELDAPKHHVGLDRLASLLDGLGAQAEREGVALWLPWANRRDAYLPDAVESAAWLMKLGLPHLKIAPRWEAGDQPAWRKAEEWQWDALAFALGGLLIGEDSPPEDGWHLPANGPEAIPIVWWPQSPRPAKALLAGAQSWNSSCLGPAPKQNSNPL